MAVSLPTDALNSRQCLGTALALFLPPLDFSPEPQFFTRLVEVQGVDPCVPEARSPIFELSLDVDQVSERKRGPCAGGGDAMLRVSYQATTGSSWPGAACHASASTAEACGGGEAPAWRALWPRLRDS